MKYECDSQKWKADHNAAFVSPPLIRSRCCSIGQLLGIFAGWFCVGKWSLCWPWKKPDLPFVAGTIITASWKLRGGHSARGNILGALKVQRDHLEKKYGSFHQVAYDFLRFGIFFSSKKLGVLLSYCYLKNSRGRMTSRVSGLFMPHVHYTWPSMGLQMHEILFQISTARKSRRSFQDCHAELKLFDFQRLQLCLCFFLWWFFSLAVCWNQNPTAKKNRYDRIRPQCW